HYHPPVSVHCSSFLFFCPRPSTLSPLFPYTTLFRSNLLIVPYFSLFVIPAMFGLLIFHWLPNFLTESFEKFFLLIHEHVLLERTDRKSTRLNSSHASTSYAVFCLQKKTTDKYTDKTN